MDKSNIYDRRLFKEEFKNSDKFTKMCIFKNKYDKDNRLILRDYRVIPITENEKISNSEYEYIIWGNNENISRMR